MNEITFTLKSKQARYGKALLDATYVKTGKLVHAKIFPPHDQVDKFSILIVGYPTEPVKTFFAPTMDEALEFVQNYYEREWTNPKQTTIIKLERK